MPLLAHGQTTLAGLCRRQRQTEYSNDAPAPPPHPRVCVLLLLVPLDLRKQKKGWSARAGERGSQQLTEAQDGVDSQKFQRAPGSD